METFIKCRWLRYNDRNDLALPHHGGLCHVRIIPYDRWKRDLDQVYPGYCLRQVDGPGLGQTALR